MYTVRIFLNKIRLIIFYKPFRQVQPHVLLRGVLRQGKTLTIYGPSAYSMLPYWIEVQVVSE